MIKVYIDGAVEPKNPGGHGAAAWLIYRDEELRNKGSKYFAPFPEMTNNVAEYAALREAMAWLYRQGLSDEWIVFYSDSKLVINQMFGDWRMIKGAYVALAKRCKKGLGEHFSKASGRWIPRTENAAADALARECLKNRNVEFRIQP